MFIKVIKTRILYRLLIALTLALCLFPASGSPAAAINIADYFTISYTVEFSSAEVFENQVFQATVTGEAAYISELPLTVSEAYVTGRVIAKHEDSGAEVILNSSYTISINPFPGTVGEVVQASQTVALQFPEESLPGSYSVIGELIEAKVKAVLWFNVTSYLPPLQAMGTISYMPPQPDDDEEDSPEQPFTGTTYTEGNINQQGVITETIIAPSVDNNCIITVEEGIKALDKYGQPLEKISIIELEELLLPPEHCRITSLIYDIGPDGATFEPPAVLTICYDESQIPAGISEDKLVIATWDETSGQWIEIGDCVVNAVANTITASVSHFTAFTVLAHNAPAAFSISGLYISPAEVDAGGNVTISIMVSNSGDLAGSYEVALIIDSQLEETKEITLDGQTSEVVTFTASRSAPGLYLLSVNDMPGSFTVLESVVVEDTEDSPAAFSISGLYISPAEVDAGGNVTISIMVSNSGDLAGSYEVALIIDSQLEETKEITLDGQTSEVVTFTASRSAPGLYLLSVNDMPGSFTVFESVVVEDTEDSPAALAQIEESTSYTASPRTTNWWLIGGIFTVDTILLVIIGIWLMRRRRKARQAEKEQIIISSDLPIPLDGELKE